MVIKMNPYGVGMSGATVGTYPRDCFCCRVEFAWTGMEHDKTAQRCPACAEHDPSTLAGEVDMLREHNNRMHELLDTARAVARSAHREINRQKEDVAEAKRKTAAALASRNDWRGILDRLEEAHPTYRGAPEICECGTTNCPVAAALVEAWQLHRGLGTGRD
jgi:hypothetical protein